MENIPYIPNQSLESIFFFNELNFESFRKGKPIPQSSYFSNVSVMGNDSIDIILNGHTYFSMLTIDFSIPKEVIFVFNATYDNKYRKKYKDLINKICKFFDCDKIDYNGKSDIPLRLSFKNNMYEIIIDNPSVNEFILRLILFT